MWLATWLGCGLLTPHDLWLDIELNGRSKTHVHLPANWILDEDEPIEIETTDGRIELREQAERLRGDPLTSTRTWTIDGDPPTTLTLLEQPPHRGEAATRIRIGGAGKKGFGMGVTTKIGSLGPSRALIETHLAVDGLRVEFGPAFSAQLAASAPTTLLDVDGPKGGTFEVTTE